MLVAAVEWERFRSTRLDEQRSGLSGISYERWVHSGLQVGVRAQRVSSERGDTRKHLRDQAQGTRWRGRGQASGRGEATFRERKGKREAARLGDRERNVDTFSNKEDTETGTETTHLTQWHTG